MKITNRLSLIRAMLLALAASCLVQCREETAPAPPTVPADPGTDAGEVRDTAPPTVPASPPLIAIIDSGVDAGPVLAHAFAESKPLAAVLPARFVPDPGLPLFGWDAITGKPEPIDRTGHGTHVAAIIAHELGLADDPPSSDFRLLAIRSGDQSHSLDHLINAVLALNELKEAGLRIPVVVLPVEFYPVPGQAAQLAQWEAAFSRLLDGKTLCIAAAGNRGQNIDLEGGSNRCYPSSFDFPDLLAVACCNESGHRTPVSNTGAVSVDLAAPGFAIESLWLNGERRKATGTSQSCAFVAARAALLWPDHSGPAAVQEALLQASCPHPSLLGKVRSNGYLKREPKNPD